ncbi:MAG: LTA synthase family protein, partial [Tannerella sp.]|nr:LTA synthase family protein [Tannerella sp.]
LLACSVIVARGGITVSTMNASKVYFSNSMYLNQAAINPAFNLFSSIRFSQQDFASQYRFMPDDEAAKIFETLHQLPDSVPVLLKTERPDIVFVILESCGSSALKTKDVMPNMLELSHEGLFFSNMYANSFRTDRGLAAILAGYPAQPDMSIIKYPKKTRNMTSIPAILHENGYNCSYLHGGDVDFANIKSFLINQKITDIERDTAFPVKDLLNKWGAPDHITFPRLLESINEEARHPSLKIFLTLSSHEPFDVPFDKFDEPYLNSVAYTDSCFGAFVADLKKSSAWNNTLLIVLPDHAALFPSSLAYNSPARHEIYMLWLGGALNISGNIARICTQIDLAATLMAQLKIDASQLKFSRNIVSPHFTDFAFYTFPNGFGVVNKSSTAVFDCNSNRITTASGSEADSILLTGKAFLQTLFDDIAKK